MQRRSYRVSKAGTLNNLNLVTEELGKPKDNEVTVEVKAIGLNFADVFTIYGLYKAAPKRNFIPGLEFSGVIIDKGKDVLDLKINDKVMGVVKFGSFTTHLNIDYRYIIRQLGDWSFEEGASFIVQASTAYYALTKLGGLSQNQTVLIHSAAGGVGIYANRIAKKYSAYTIGTIGNPSKTELLKTEGYDQVIVRDKNLKNEIINKLNGRELNLVMDAVGGREQKVSFDLLPPTGRMVSYGLSLFSPHGSYLNPFSLLVQYLSMPRYNTLTLIESNKSVLGFNLIWLYERVELFKDMLKEIDALKLERPYVGRVYDFENLKEAVKIFKKGSTTGKVVVKTF
ncbi:MAG: zinc-binding dehydrogenase [Ignavibacteriaceae bacterium]|jgi:alcohol dehydrogenase